jgi:hypothetical protein
MILRAVAEAVELAVIGVFLTALWWSSEGVAALRMAAG